MKGDLSRDTFDRTRRYSAVRLQQGRVVTDADWNEQADIVRNRIERETRDVVGACGVPFGASGFGLVAETRALAVHAIDANVAWISAEGGTLLTTTNAGADWTLVDVATDARVRAIAQVAGTGWAVGDRGAVRKTSDTGSHWTAQDAGTLATLRAVAVFDADHAWAVGDGGIAMATDDGGATWRLAQTDATRLDAVHFVDPLHGLAAGRGGTLVSTDDGGATWTRLASGVDAHLHAMTGFDTTHVWAAGRDGTIVLSADFGATWSSAATPTSATLHGIAFRDALDGWAVGDRGTVLRSTDGGATWTVDAGAASSIGGDTTLVGIALAGNEAPWVVSDDGRAWRIGAGSPDLVPIALPATGLSITPGRCYVDGVMCELDRRTSYAHQSDSGPVDRLVPGSWLVYLDAWQRHLSAIEAPAIREVALGGPDTATRSQTVAQVKAIALPVESPSVWSCASQVDAWDALVAVPRPRLAARADPQLEPANLCELAATAGYRRLENQLYRVEVHDGGGTPTFKWSRENGSVAYAVVSIDVDTAQGRTLVRLAARGRDANLDLAIGDRVELVDDAADLAVRKGVLFEYVKDGDDALEVVLAGTAPAPWSTIGRDASRHPLLRRWDHRPTTAGTNALPIVEGTWIELEDGVQVRFAPGNAYRSGDYWQIPARTITSDVEWPRDDDGDPIDREAAGIVDAYCRLGIVEVDARGVVTIASDCRATFPPLTRLKQLLYVSGDGQQGTFGASLPHPLEMRVANGSDGVAGARLVATVEQGGGSIAGGPDFTTDAGGELSLAWTLGASGDQRVRVDLVDDDGITELQRLAFNASVGGGTTTVSTVGCDVTIGPGGDLPALDSAALEKLIKRGRGDVCICFMPGTHDVTDLAASGEKVARIAIHGCGHSSTLRLRKPVVLRDFVAIELRDLVVESDPRVGILLQNSEDVRVVALDYRRDGGDVENPCLRIVGVPRTVEVTGCTLQSNPDVPVLVFDGIDGDCRVRGNRCIGVVSFYGFPIVLTQGPGTLDEIRRKAAAGGVRFVDVDRAVNQLVFEANHVSQLAVSQAAIDGVFGAVPPVSYFDVASFSDNVVDAALNTFVSRALTFASTTFTARVASGQSIYALVIAGPTAVSGNVGVVTKVPFRVLSPGPVAQAANAIDFELN